MIEEKNTVFNFVDITMARTYKVYRDLRELSAEEIEDFRKVMLSMGLYNGRFPYVTEVINSVVDEAYLALAKDMLTDKAFCGSMMDRIRQVCKDVCRAPHFSLENAIKTQNKKLQSGCLRSSAVLTNLLLNPNLIVMLRNWHHFSNTLSRLVSYICLRCPMALWNCAN